MKVTASIIIRTYNEEDWIGHCLTSIQNQKFKNYEIIIVDNFSKDNTVKIAKSFNGGGHAFASGAVLHQSLNEAKKVIVDKTRKMIQEQLDNL